MYWDIFLAVEPKKCFWYFPPGAFCSSGTVCYWAELGQSGGVGPHTFLQLATILAALNDLLGPGGATWDPPVGSFEAVIPWRASYCPLSEPVSHPVRPSSSAWQGFHIFQIAFRRTFGSKNFNFLCIIQTGLIPILSLNGDISLVFGRCHDQHMRYHNCQYMLVTWHGTIPTVSDYLHKPPCRKNILINNMTSVIWAIGIYATLFVLDFFCLRANPAPRAKVTHRQGRNLPWKHIFSSQVHRDLMVLWITCSPVWKREWLWKGRPPFTPACPRTLFKWQFVQVLLGDHRTYKM